MQRFLQFYAEESEEEIEHDPQYGGYESDVDHRFGDAPTAEHDAPHRFRRIEQRRGPDDVLEEPVHALHRPENAAEEEHAEKVSDAEERGHHLGVEDRGQKKS